MNTYFVMWAGLYPWSFLLAYSTFCLGNHSVSLSNSEINICQNIKKNNKITFRTRGRSNRTLNRVYLTRRLVSYSTIFWLDAHQSLLSLCVQLQRGKKRHDDGLIAETCCSFFFVVENTMFDFQIFPLVRFQFGTCRKPRRLSPGDNSVLKCVTFYNWSGQYN